MSGSNIASPGTSAVRRLGFAAALFCAVATAPLSRAAGDDPPGKPALADDRDYRAGRAAIDAQDWKTAMTALGRAASRYRDDAGVYNWLGYAARRSGDLDTAFRHYRTALRLDPNHRGAHEYIGEAYLQKKDVASAEKHLAELARICGAGGCEEHRDLAAKITRAKGS